MKNTLTPTQEFWLAFIVAGAKTKISKPYSTGRSRGRRGGWRQVPRGHCHVKGVGLRTARALAKLKLVTLKNDGGSDYDFWNATPTEAGIEAVKRYKPDTPERQVQLWGHKAPQLKTLAKFIEENFDDVEVEMSDWSYTPEHALGNTRLVSRGRTRHGKRLAVWPKRYQDRDRYPLLKIVGPDPMDTNDKAVRWIAEKMGIRLEA